MNLTSFSSNAAKATVSFILAWVSIDRGQNIYGQTAGVPIVTESKLSGSASSQQAFYFSLSGDGHQLQLRGKLTAPGSLDVIFTEANTSNYSNIPEQYYGSNGDLIIPDVPAGDYKIVVFGKTNYSGFNFELDDVSQLSTNPQLTLKVGRIDARLTESYTNHGTGTVIASNTGNLILTAAHVIYSKQHGSFVSGSFTNGEARYKIMQVWIEAGYNPSSIDPFDNDFAHDVAIVSVKTQPKVSYVPNVSASLASMQLLKPKLNSGAFPDSLLQDGNLKELFGCYRNGDDTKLPPTLQSRYSRDHLRTFPTFSKPVFLLNPDGETVEGGFSGGPVLINTYIPSAGNPVGYSYKQIGIIVGNSDAFDYDIVHIFNGADFKFFQGIDASITSK